MSSNMNFYEEESGWVIAHKSDYSIGRILVVVPFTTNSTKDHQLIRRTDGSMYISFYNRQLYDQVRLYF